MRRQGAESVIVLLLIAAAITLSAGCSFVSVETKQYLGVPLYSPTDPASVEILRAEPQRPHEQLGEITLEPTGEPPVAEIEQKLRIAAAKLGANAAVLVADRTMRMGAMATGPRYGRQVSPELQRVIIAVAIRYTQ
jgi:hypothetical protein